MKYLLLIVSLVVLSSCGKHIYGPEKNLKPGDFIDTFNSGKIYFLRFEGDNLILNRMSEWPIPAQPAEISIGNREYLHIKEINKEEGYILVQIEQTSHGHPLDF